MIILAYMYKGTINAVLCSNILLTLPQLDAVLLKNQNFIDALDLVSEGYFIIKQKAGIDCLNLPTTSSLRCLCETTLMFTLLSEDVLTDSFDITFETFWQANTVFHMLDHEEQYRLYKFDQMMRVINRLFWKRKLKGNFIALAASATEGDHITYNTGGASNVKTKCREIIFHAVTGIPIIPRPRRMVQHHEDDKDQPSRKRKIDPGQAEIDDKLNACLLKFRSDLMEKAKDGHFTPVSGRKRGRKGSAEKPTYFPIRLQATAEREGFTSPRRATPTSSTKAQAYTPPSSSARRLMSPAEAAAVNVMAEISSPVRKPREGGEPKPYP